MILYPRSVTEVDLERFRAPRPHRADGARNFDAIVEASRIAFHQRGADVALDIVAEQAGVGIATLYRNFPTREALLQHLYIEEVAAIVADADSVTAMDPWEGLVLWVRRFVKHLGNKQVLAVAINPGTEVYAACSKAILGAAAPLIERARESGDLRQDVTDMDLARAVYGIATIEVDSEAQRQRILDVFLRGLAPVAP